MCMVVKDPLQVIGCKQQQLMSGNVLVLLKTTKGSTLYIGLLFEMAESKPQKNQVLELTSAAS